LYAVLAFPMSRQSHLPLLEIPNHIRRRVAIMQSSNISSYFPSLRSIFSNTLNICPSLSERKNQIQTKLIYWHLSNYSAQLLQSIEARLTIKDCTIYSYMWANITRSKVFGTCKTAYHICANTVRMKPWKP
jgi:hypothetical protein